MKRSFTVLLVFVCSICFFGCDEENTIFFIDDETKKKYTAEISEMLGKKHWNYDEEHISYEQGNIPNEQTAGFDEVKRAVKAGGFEDIENFKGQNAVCASVELFYFNNEKAGKAYFYFVDDDMICGYYISNDNIYAVSEIDVFLEDVFDGKTENIEKKNDFYQVDAEKTFDGFDDGFWKNSVVGEISEDKAKFFKFQNNKFYLEKEFDFSKDGLFPMDISFDDEGNVAILLGKKKKTEHDVIYNNEDIQEMKENGLTEAEINEAEILASNRIVFFDSHYNTIFNPCQLEVSSYSSINFDGNSIFLSRGKGIDVFSNSNGTFSKTKQYILKQWAESIDSADIDGDGIKEFIITDNTNLFLYHLEDVPMLLWKTHLSLKSMSRRFYVEDINGDGVKEIYVSDDFLRTSVKYVLTDYGFKGFSTAYSDEIIPGDFDGNGKMDYMVINNDDNSCKIYICK